MKQMTLESAIGAAYKQLEIAENRQPIEAVVATNGAIVTLLSFIAAELSDLNAKLRGELPNT